MSKTLASLPVLPNRWPIYPEMDAAMAELFHPFQASGRNRILGLQATGVRSGQDDLALWNPHLLTRAEAQEATGEDLHSHLPWKIAEHLEDEHTLGRFFMALSHFDAAPLAMEQEICWNVSSISHGYDMREVFLLKNAILVLDTIHAPSAASFEETAGRNLIYLRPPCSAHDLVLRRAELDAIEVWLTRKFSIHFNMGQNVCGPNLHARLLSNA